VGVALGRYSSKLRDLILFMLVLDPTQRPFIDDVLQRLGVPPEPSSNARFRTMLRLPSPK